MSNGLTRCIMEEFDTTNPTPEPNPECIDSYSRKRIAELAEISAMLLERIRALDAALADLHSDRAQRLQQIDLDDQEWY